MLRTRRGRAAPVHLGGETPPVQRWVAPADGIWHTGDATAAIGAHRPPAMESDWPVATADGARSPRRQHPRGLVAPPPALVTHWDRYARHCETSGSTASTGCNDQGR